MCIIHKAWWSVGDLLDVADECVVHIHLAGVFSLAVPCGQGSGFFDGCEGDGQAFCLDHDVRAGDLPRVQPQIRLGGFFEREEFILGIVLPHEDAEAVDGECGQERFIFTLVVHRFLFPPTDALDAGIFQLFLQSIQILFGFDLRRKIQHIFKVADLFMTFVQLFTSDDEARFHFIVFFEIELAVCGDRKKRIDRDRFFRRGIIEKVQDGERFSSIDLFIGVDRKQIAPELVLLRLGGLLHFPFDLLDLSLFPFDEGVDLLLVVRELCGHGTAGRFGFPFEPRDDGAAFDLLTEEGQGDRTDHRLPLGILIDVKGIRGHDILFEEKYGGEQGVLLGLCQGGEGGCHQDLAQMAQLIDEETGEAVEGMEEPFFDRTLCSLTVVEYIFQFLFGELHEIHTRAVCRKMVHFPGDEQAVALSAAKTGIDDRIPFRQDKIR